MGTRNHPPQGRSRFFSNTVALVVQTTLATLITLAQVKILSNFLAKDTFGLFASLRGFSLLLAMIAANGLPQLLLRYVPLHESQGARNRAIRLSAACLAGSVLLLAVLAVIVYILRPWLLAFVSPGLATGSLLLWFGVTTASVMLKQVLYGGVSGLRRLTVQMVIELASLAGVLVWIMVARHDLTLTLLFRILGTVNGVSVLVGIPLYFAMLARTRGATSRVQGASDYHGYLVWATGISFVAVAFTDADRYLLAQMLSLELLALFHIGARVARLGHRLLGVANLAFQPEVTRISAEGRRDEIGDVTRVFMKFNVATAMILTIGLVLFAREIITVVASPEYLAAVPLMMILAASLPVTTLTAPVTTVMKALDEVKGALVVDLVWALTYVGLVLAFTPAFGLVGVGAASVGASLAQLTAAVRISRLVVAGPFIGRVALKVGVATLASWWPVYVAGVVLGESVTAVAVKLVLFAVGIALYLRLIHALALFDTREQSMLHDILRTRGLQAFVRFV